MKLYVLMYHDYENTDVVAAFSDKQKAQSVKDYLTKSSKYNSYSIEEFDDSCVQTKPVWRCRYVRGKYIANSINWCMLSPDDTSLVSHSSLKDNWTTLLYADTKEEALSLFKEKLRNELEPWEIEKGKIIF